MGLRSTGKGIGYTYHADETLKAGVYDTGQVQYGFVFKTDTVQDSRFAIGDIVVLPDGRTYVYSKSAGACISGQGCEFTAAGYTSYTAFAVAAAIGATQVTVPAATHSALTLDELRGGYIVIYDGSTNNVQFRRIIGNDAADANALFVCYIDAPLTEAVVASTSACETFQNPYAALQTGTMNYTKKAGIPAVKVTAANVYFWCQISGPCWVAPQGGKLGTTEGGYAGGLWSDVGNVSDFATSLGVTVANGRGSQYAGYPVLGDADNIGPLFMLRN
jgi:hypothetical protein